MLSTIGILITHPSNYKLGNDYVSALIAAVEAGEVHKLMLRDNNIKGGEVMQKIQDTIAPIEVLDLSENEIGRHVMCLRYMITDAKSR